MSFEIKTSEAGISIEVNAHALTRLIRPSEAATDWLHVPPAPLAEWLVGNWWRLRWEPLPADPIPATWQLAHDLRSVNHGYVWPNVRIWGEDGRMRFFTRADPVGVVGPVRFLADLPEQSILAREFEQGTDSFLAAILAGTPQLEALQQERRSLDHAAWRRLEARLGYDPDTVPHELMGALSALANQYGEMDIEEAASASPGPNAAEILHQEIEYAQSEQALPCDFSNARSTLRPQNHGEADALPWQAAEALASRLRNQFGLTGPLSDQQLGELTGISSDAFQYRLGPQLPYGLRLQTHMGERLALRARWHDARRFESARALGDALYPDAATDASANRLGPIVAASHTARQQFQRAFAADLLCHCGDLMEYLGNGEPEAEDIVAAARHFAVSEFAVRTTLVNHNVISREQFRTLAASA